MTTENSHWRRWYHLECWQNYKKESVRWQGIVVVVMKKKKILLPSLSLTLHLLFIDITLLYSSLLPYNHKFKTRAKGMWMIVHFLQFLYCLIYLTHVHWKKEERKQAKKNEWATDKENSLRSFSSMAQKDTQRVEEKHLFAFCRSND